MRLASSRIVSHSGMTTANERLLEARVAAGYATPTDAAHAMGIKSPTYLGHENGSRGLARSAERYARFFKVSLDWLVSGRGTMRQVAASIPLLGYVGAGGAVAMVDTDDQVSGEIGMFDHRWMGALIVRGDSQYPRYQDGEIVLFDTRKRQPSELVGHYAVVHTNDDRRMIKILRRSENPNAWRLDSHNAPPEDDVVVTSIFAIAGTITR